MFSVLQLLKSCMYPLLRELRLKRYRKDEIGKNSGLIFGTKVRKRCDNIEQKQPYNFDPIVFWCLLIVRRRHATINQN